LLGVPPPWIDAEEDAQEEEAYTSASTRRARGWEGHRIPTNNLLLSGSLSQPRFGSGGLDSSPGDALAWGAGAEACEWTSWGEEGARREVGTETSAPRGRIGANSCPASLDEAEAASLPRPPPPPPPSSTLSSPPLVLDALAPPLAALKFAETEPLVDPPALRTLTGAYTTAGPGQKAAASRSSTSRDSEKVTAGRILCLGVLSVASLGSLEEDALFSSFVGLLRWLVCAWLDSAVGASGAGLRTNVLGLENRANRREWEGSWRYTRGTSRSRMEEWG